MKVAAMMAEILKREGVRVLPAYPLNNLIEAAADIGIPPVIVRQERVAVHMADAISRLSAGDTVGVTCMQAGPGVENAFGAVAQAWSEAVPLVAIPGGSARSQAFIKPGFNATLNFQQITKWSEFVSTASQVAPAMKRAFTQARNGRPGPVLLEIPGDLWNEEAGDLDYTPARRILSQPSDDDIERAAKVLIDAKRPLIYAGQGVHYARAWAELRELAELLEVPVTTSLEGKSAFPENHSLSLGSGGVAMPGQVFEHVKDADVVFGVGASFTQTGFGIRFPRIGKIYIHNCNDPIDINKNVQSDYPLIGDAKLTLQALIAAVKDRIGRARGRKEEVVARIAGQREAWLKDWAPRLNSNAAPLSPYRVIRDLLATCDVANTIITHDAGSPRDELSPFWQTTAPHTYIGWGKTTQLGYGLGLAMGAKLAKPDKLCINTWGDAAIGMTGMDFETAVRCKIPVLSILFNNFSMAMENQIMKLSMDKYRSTDISGNYSEFAKALGGYGERITAAADIVPALKRGIAATKDGTPALLEFITTTEKAYSTFQYSYHS